MRDGLPLDGLVVVAIEQAVAAPFCSSRLADAGARVIKVERPEGDFARGYDDVVAGGQSSYFVWLNRGKESAVVDLATEAGKESLRTLVAGADVLIQNLKPGALDRLGFGTEALCRQHPRLIACSISGYGETGPLASRKAYDLLIQAESGLSSITGGPDEPARVGISIVDIATGATAHAAILEALIGRGITGRGADIRISMFDVMADWLTVPLLHQEGGRPPKRLGLAHPSIAPYGVFATKDGKRLLISIQSDREWVKFCTLFVGDAAAGKDPLFATNVARTRNRAETDAMVARAFAGLDEAAAVARLTEADVAFASVNDMAALATHPHIRRITVGTPSGPVAFPAPAARIEGVERAYGTVPGLGEHGGA
ncbi:MULTISPECIES: CaiB/BaiF CoA-transferase family protein [unclassified Methylobacterium]|jgi:crotonobetainyl-CoA:carnitine CoA-transferase CaiB-like acyl-CoA transferase|uniref:CaiB/BaiF CoA transferase family protein n=1 Tax=unclassified Methylobacterium TaxID=2615210 RepID=UPI0005B76B66|nr:MULTISPECIES: CaiB/BaiF CoA-transferase family protein [unclassified Methylobacterium]SFU94355.1 Crotonobetainyl-CoA:carnitine CoA-transferase CaiB [Methylobacterium sp. UNCCL125]